MSGKVSQPPPFYNISTQTSDDERTERLSILTQFFLAILTVYSKSKGISNLNLGQLLDSSPVLSYQLVNKVSDALNKGEDVEECICTLFNTHVITMHAKPHANEFLPRPLSIKDIAAIKKRFEQTYRIVTATKENPHMDDFLILDTEDTGESSRFVTHQGSICVNFAEIICPVAASANQEYFNQIRKDFAIHPIEIPHKNEWIAGGIELEPEIILAQVSFEQFEQLPKAFKEECFGNVAFQEFQIHLFFYYLAKGKQNEAETIFNMGKMDLEILLAQLSFKKFIKLPKIVKEACLAHPTSQYFQTRLFFYYIAEGKQNEAEAIFNMGNIKLDPNTLLTQVSFDEFELLPKIVKETCFAHPASQEFKVGLFLNHIAKGKQEEAEALLSSTFIHTQELLKIPGVFTDYSGRTFYCTAFEYAYWAKDIYMCRMLERHMDVETKVQICSLVEKMECTDITTGQKIGLEYQQDGDSHQSAHFDFTPLKEALHNYANGIDGWIASGNFNAKKEAWLAVGIAQRDVPAHVAQEYCRPDRHFYPKPHFKEETLPRVLTFENLDANNCNDFWFPLLAANAGIGFDVTVARGHRSACGASPKQNEVGWRSASAANDLAALSFLDEVRTLELLELRDHLTETLEEYPEKKLIKQFLQHVAFGQQEEAEQILQQNPVLVKLFLTTNDISFTDYSGRTFTCTAYEYAYWACDSHMRWMLEEYILNDEEMRHFIYQRVKHMEEHIPETSPSSPTFFQAHSRPRGLHYTQHGKSYHSVHFDFKSLINALDENINQDDHRNWNQREEAWQKNVGSAQRQVPAHLAQEYCHPNRNFKELPQSKSLLNKKPFKRQMKLYNYVEGCSYDMWFPLKVDSGLGFSFGILRGGVDETSSATKWSGGWDVTDLLAVKIIEEVRVGELKQSFERLSRPLSALSRSYF